VESFVLGRLHASGLAEAALVAAGTARLAVTHTVSLFPHDVLASLDGEANARLPVEPLRLASRRLGRQLARLAMRCWSDTRIEALELVHPDGPHQVVALAAVAAACGVTPRESAALALHHLVTTPTQAAVKLAGLDPFGAAALIVRFGTDIEALAESAAALVGLPLADLPCAGNPLMEIAAVHHDRRTDRLFAT
jgi:urease accessory protein